MKNFRFIYICIGTLLLLSCVREDLDEGLNYVGDDEVLASFEFSHKDFEEVKVTTKATLGLIPESRVQNIFVYIFVDGKKVYAHYFDNKNAMTSEDICKLANSNCWYVTNRSSEDPAADDTHGVIKIKAPELSGGTMYLIANINADMVNISPEKLNMIKTEDELKNLTAQLNQEITSRNGYFPMVDYVDGIAVDGSTGAVTRNGGKDLGIYLERLDAKVKVNVRVATDNELESTEDDVTTIQRLKEFVPESWRVVNIPKGAYIIERESEDYEEAGYFNTSAVKFEEESNMEYTYTNASDESVTITSPVHSFSFYMLENRESQNKNESVNKDYHKRDLRKKDASGEYLMESGDMWQYAPEYGTYLEIKGEVLMEVNVSNEAKTQQLVSSVTYYVHLGDVVHSEVDADAHDNYDIDRNTFYTYTITIKGVNAIETEVTTSTDVREGTLTEIIESESGATGDVYIAKESVYTFDAHYGQRVFCFDAAQIDPDNVTWYVKTPFGKEGIPNRVEDTEIPSGLDYKWVHFLVNEVSDTQDAVTGTYPYSQNNMKWPGDPDDGYESDAETELWESGRKVMDVVEFTKYIKEQKRRLDAGQTNDFRREFDQDWFDKFGDGYETTDDGVWHRDRIYVTVFVDEYYYEADPITGEEREGLWKEFVNKPNRLMHILCDNDLSLDEESSATGSVITLRQRSIQTPYNLDYANTAWGCETADEFRESYLWYFSSKESESNLGITLNSKGNNSETNGLFNTVKLIGLDGTQNWSTYIDYNRVNDYLGQNYDYAIFFMKEDYMALLYTVLLRNRDNNGNDIIDPEEIRWYQASLEQVLGLGLGGLGLSADAQLYPPAVASATGVFESGHPFEGYNKWMLKVVSSTCRANKSETLPITVWAEESVSISHYRESLGWGQQTKSPYSIRCVRNLGLPDVTKDNLSDADQNEPESLVVSDNSTGEIRFDLRRINETSLRYYTTKELEPGDENSEMSRLYYGFDVGDKVDITDYRDLKTMLESGQSPCPEGWRTPNLREASLMYMYCNDDATWWGGSNTLVSSYTSLGKYGSMKKNSADSWYIGYNYASFNINGTASVRCVKDSHPDNW